MIWTTACLVHSWLNEHFRSDSWNAALSAICQLSFPPGQVGSSKDIDLTTAADRTMPEQLLATLRTVCPEVALDIASHWDKPVTDYAGHLIRPVPAPRSEIAIRSRAILRQALGDRVKAILPVADHDNVLAAFDRHPVIQAGVHSQLLFDRITFNAFLLGWLGAVEQRLPAFFVFTGTTVTMETVGKEGPGWLDLGDQQINLFGMGRHKLCRQSVAGAGPVSLNIDALRAVGSTHPGLEQLVIQAGRKWGNAADAMADVNSQLVASWDAAITTSPVFFDDRHAALALARHLDDENGLITRLLTDPTRRMALEQALEAAATGPFGRFLPIATTHFWGVREKRVRKMTVADGRLIEVDRPQGVSVPLERQALRDALQNGILLPNLFFLFLVMSLLPRVRVLGGFRQIGYVPVFQGVLRDLLNRDNPDEAALLEELTTLENAWGMRVIEESQSVFDQIGAHAPGKLLGELRQIYSKRRFADVTDGLRLLSESPRWRKLARTLGIAPAA